jgi:hypothetical protein
VHVSLTRNIPGYCHHANLDRIVCVPPDPIWDSPDGPRTSKSKFITSSYHAETLTRLTKEKALGTNYDVTTNAPWTPSFAVLWEVRTVVYGICTDDRPPLLSQRFGRNETVTYDDEHSELLTAGLHH